MEAFIIVFLIFAGLFFLLRKENKRKIEYNNHKNEQIESVTALDRGTWSERDLVYELLEHGIAPGAIFHDLYVKKANGRHAQIDLVVATKVGLIVFEVKDYSGWIFGRGNQDKWTQVLAYGRDKYRFYNPIKQNAGHIAELQKQSKQMSEIPMFSVVVFYGGCTLRDVSIIPHNTYVTTWRRALDVVDTILEENEPANYTNKHEIVRILKAAVENGAKENMA